MTFATHCFVTEKMAMNVLRVFLRANTRNYALLGRNNPSKISYLNRTMQSRNVVSSSTGAILPKPDKTPFGLIRMTAVVVPFLYVGTLISKNFAALLEEHDIFVPEDDDDDD
ncbi:essential MCU regulator, mitochondrial-like [Stigmatopora argus]